MLKNTEEAIRMKNLEKLATWGTQDEENKNTTQNLLDTTMCKQTKITQIRHASLYKQLRHIHQ
jgi:transcriptional regulator NrdR family protein